jgi:hypothetical protein
MMDLEDASMRIMAALGYITYTAVGYLPLTADVRLQVDIQRTTALYVLQRPRRRP